MAERRRQGPQERAVRKDLRGLESLEGIEAFAVLALGLARTLDDGVEKAADQARLTSELRRTLTELGRVGRKKAASDGLDEVRRRREQRRRTQA
ncbi:hypothetical protein ACFWYW_14560 [Nonomuraea sp. NPDC059023]|uniref:hypothetical protein n=1 Tax=unclassified Nonomuraea TaxID=2593643 RepID=UPI0036C7C37F